MRRKLLLLNLNFPDYSSFFFIDVSIINLQGNATLCLDENMVLYSWGARRPDTHLSSEIADLDGEKKARRKREGSKQTLGTEPAIVLNFCQTLRQHQLDEAGNKSRHTDRIHKVISSATVARGDHQRNAWRGSVFSADGSTLFSSGMLTDGSIARMFDVFSSICLLFSVHNCFLFHHFHF